MKNQYPIIAAAVAAALTAAGYVHAAPPALTSAESPTGSLVIAGSSAAQTSVANAIENDICGGASNTLVVGSTGNKNFFAYSCSIAQSIGSMAANSVVTIYYRTEGGSVVGALPIAGNGGATQIKRLLLNSSCTASGAAGTCGVTGTTSTSGPNDSWGGNVTPDYVQLGVTDVEPAQLTNFDYPSAYSTTAFGTATPAQLASLNPVRAIQQVFGFGVNTNGLTLATPGVVNLSRESAANIEFGSYSDWHNVPDALTGQPISSAAVGVAPITRVDRENGSGTRTSANIYLFNYQCGGGSAIVSPSTEALNYSTADELTDANTIPGAIAYASIDNLLPPKNTSYTNLVLATLSGITPSTLAAAAGQYDYWFEATLVPNPNTTAVPAGSNTAALSAFLVGDVPKLSKAPIAADINVVPNVAGNGPGTVPLTVRNGTISGTLTGNIYLNPFTRSGNSCNYPSETN